MGLVSKVLTAGVNKPIKQYRKRAAEVTKLEPKFEAMSDDELFAYTDVLKERASKLTPVESMLSPQSAKDAKKAEKARKKAEKKAKKSGEDDIPDLGMSVTSQETFNEIKDSLDVDKQRPDYNAKRSKEEWQIEYEAFAHLREVIKRHDGRRAYDVQIMCAMALFDGNVAEAKTGEGKALVAFFPSYLNAIYGRQTHVVSVNDYLTQRDSEECAGIVRPLGITVGRVYNQQPIEQKRNAYRCDIVYGTPSEFGFDYLRDNMAMKADDRVQRGHNYALVDECDSILIDEARTPLIISGGAKNEDDVYRNFAKAVLNLKRSTNDGEQGVPPNNDYVLDEEKKQIAATDEGLKKIEARLGIEDIYVRPDAANLTNHLMQALKAEYMFKRDKDYIVTHGEVKIVDEFTGRIMEGRRWSEGLHQAIEAKEGVQIQPENQTLATITLQNYFRMYDKLSGMTGTALTEESEFRQTYFMNVIPIPTNKPVQRIDAVDRIYRTEKAKYEAVVEEIVERHATGQPILVGTVSVEHSEMLSDMLDARGIWHQTLNARQNAAEADIIAQAGRFGAVTIATNMAGRGTDIMLGGNVKGMAKIELKKKFPDYDTPKASEEDAKVPTQDDIDKELAEAQKVHDEEYGKVIKAGGLCVIGSERHESRRIDNQLRGRSGRQGDPGYSQFYVSLEDDLMRIFGADRMAHISDVMKKNIGDDSIPIEMKLVSKGIESAQRKVETMNAEIRKHVLEYDDVINRQRSVIYAERNAILDGKDLDAYFKSIIRHVAENTVRDYCQTDHPINWDVDGLKEWYKDVSGNANADFIDDAVNAKKANRSTMVDTLDDKLKKDFNVKKLKVQSAEIFTMLESGAMLRIIDQDWIEYLSEMDYLKTGIGLRGFGQRDPLVEYKTEAFNAFRNLVATMYEETLKTILRTHIYYKDESALRQPPANLVYTKPQEPQGSILRTMQKAKESGIGAPDIITDSDEESDAKAREESRKLKEELRTGLRNVVGDSSTPRTYIKAEHDPYAGVGRNDMCPCGSGKKFKYCHGKNR